MIFAIFLTLVLLYVGLTYWQKKTFRTITFILSPLLRLFILRRVSLGLEEKDRVNERFGIPSRERIPGKLIWIHAVSVGEALSVIPFIQEFKNINKDANIVITTITIEAANLIKNRLGDSVIHQYLPYDIFTWIRRFIKYWKPDAVFFVESEIWPNTLYYLYEKDIPVYLLNTRISAKTLKRMYLVKKLFKILPYKLFTTIFVPSDEIKGYVMDLGARDIVVIPNLKIISKKLPVDENSAKNLENMIHGRKAWLAVSTHKGEEEIIVNVHKKLKKIFPDILTFIAIRHPERASDVKSLCELAGFSAAYHTENFEEGLGISEDFYIINKMGCLGEFFEKINTVLVGGSLIPGIGGHNFLEPINFMCNVATGKYIENFRDIYPYLSNFCTKVEDENDLLEFIALSIESCERNPDMLKGLDYTKSWIDAIKQMSKKIYSK